MRFHTKSSGVLITIQLMSVRLLLLQMKPPGDAGGAGPRANLLSSPSIWPEVLKPRA